MSKIYFGFAIADGMFAQSAHASRQPLIIEQVRQFVDAGVESALNPFHKATVDAMQKRYGLMVEIPASPPKITLGVGDKFIVMSVRGLPRLTDAREYTQAEIDNAEFAFGIWEVL